MPNDELLLAGGVFLALVLFFGLFKGVVILVIAASVFPLWFELLKRCLAYRCVFQWSRCRPPVQRNP